MKNKIKAGDLIECEAAMFRDFTVGQKVEVHADEKGLYVLGGPFGRSKLELHELSISKYTDVAFAMCVGFSFVKKKVDMNGNEITEIE